MSNDNLPGGCTQEQCDGGPSKQPTDEQIADYLRDYWASFEQTACLSSDAETNHDTGDDFCFVTVPVVMKVWYDDVPR